MVVVSRSSVFIIPRWLQAFAGLRQRWDNPSGVLQLPEASEIPILQHDGFTRYNHLPMNALMALPTLDQLTGIAVFLLALLVAWFLVRIFLRIAMRIFALGCTLILVIAILLAVIRYFGSI
jgi:hypothetical protein